jgi:hypothetical protein
MRYKSKLRIRTLQGQNGHIVSSLNQMFVLTQGGFLQEFSFSLSALLLVYCILKGSFKPVEQWPTFLAQQSWTMLDEQTRSNISYNHSNRKPPMLQPTRLHQLLAGVPVQSHLW